MSQFCFDDAATATKAVNGAPRVRVYKISSKIDGKDVTKFTVGSNREVALARYAIAVHGVAVESSRESNAVSGGVSQRQYNKLIEQATTAQPDEAVKILSEAKTLKEQLDAKRAQRKANKEASTPPAPPAPPAP
jgi:hypothetical protein